MLFRSAERIEEIKQLLRNVYMTGESTVPIELAEELLGAVVEAKIEVKLFFEMAMGKDAE